MEIDTNSMPRIELEKETLSKYKVAKEFPIGDKPATSISFNDTGEYCVAGTDDSMILYQCDEGTSYKTIFSKKYGCALARFTHHDSNIIHASTKDDDALRYLTIYDNRYIRYFRGHEKRVIAVEVSPMEDYVLSASLDNTVRFWDLRSPNCQGVLTTDSKTLAAFDPQGVVFATVSQNNSIRFYDVKEYLKGPFISTTIPESLHGRLPELTGLKFTADGSYLLVSTMSGVIYVLDAFNGNLVQKLVGNAPPVPGSKGEELQATPDGRFVMAGGSDSNLRLWDLTYQGTMENKPFATLQTPHTKGVNIVGHNPSSGMLVTGSNAIALWIP